MFDAGLHGYNLEAGGIAIAIEIGIEKRKNQ